MGPSQGEMKPGLARPAPEETTDRVPSESTETDLEKGIAEDAKQTATDSSSDSDSTTAEEGQPPTSRPQTAGGGDEGKGDGRGGGGGGGGGVASRALSHVLSRVSTKSSWNPGPPPDGGLQAWTAVACTHLVVMNTWGVINSFGLFQTYYTSTLGRPPSDVSWIGSLQIFLLFFIGALTGRLTDAGYFRPVFVLGAALQLLGIFTASAATRYWHVLLAQGVCMGVGNGFLFCPCVSTLSTYFHKRRALAIALGACGSATGGLVFPGMVRQLLPAHGFPAAMRAIGYVQVATFAVAFVGLKQRIPPRKSGPLVEWKAFCEGEYALYAAGSFSFFLGLYFAFYYIASFSRDVIGLDYTSSLNLLLLMNGIGIPGRVIPNYVGDRVGTINVLVPAACLTGVCLFCWTAVRSAAGLYVWCAFYGLAAGGLQSLFPAGLSSLTADVRKAGVRMGMIFTIVSFATLAGPPIAGAIITASGGSYHGAQVFAASTLMLSTALLAAARTVKVRRLMRAGHGSGSMWKMKV
ncbi:hypothetical protein VTH06DRAFT_5899 [Thermothelomyces fergusii]